MKNKEQIEKKLKDTQYFLTVADKETMSNATAFLKGIESGLKWTLKDEDISED